MSIASTAPQKAIAGAPSSGAQPPRLAYSVAEFAAATSISRSALYLAAGKNKLKITKIGGRSVILAEDGAAFLRGKEG